MKAVKKGQRPRVVFRFDSSKEMGIGHAMRCLTLAEELRNQGAEVVALSRFLENLVRLRADRLNIPIEIVKSAAPKSDVEQICSLLPDFVVVDGYHFSSEFFIELDQRELDYAVFDDDGARADTNARLLINTSPGAKENSYEDRPGRSMAVGPKFSIIRSEILSKPRLRQKKKENEVQSVLVAIGGTDPLGIGPEIASHLQENLEAEIYIAGATIPPDVNPAPADIAEILPQIDVAVVGAGASLLETVYLGVPTVALVVADNQVVNASWAANIDFVEVVDVRKSLDLGVVAKIFERLIFENRESRPTSLDGRRELDGEGARRVASMVMGFLKQ